MASQTPGYQQYPCDLCGSEEAVEIPYVRFYTGNQPVHICSVCGFVYVRTRRSSEEIARVWSEELYGGVYTAKKHPVMMPRYHYVAGFLTSHVDIASRKICDIGAGEGLWLKFLADNHDIVPLGIEPSPSNCAEMAQLGIESFTGTIEQFGAKPENRSYRADVVTILWTLENCLSCIDMLKGAAALVQKADKSSWQRAAASWFRSRSRCSRTSLRRRRTFTASDSARTLCKPLWRRRDSVPSRPIATWTTTFFAYWPRKSRTPAPSSPRRSSARSAVVLRALASGFAPLRQGLGPLGHDRPQRRWRGTPQVSVYVVSRDYGTFLREAIESVLRQHHDDWELLLIDDGSSDNTADVMRLYSGDPRVRVFRTYRNRAARRLQSRASRGARQVSDSPRWRRRSRRERAARADELSRARAGCRVGISRLLLDGRGRGDSCARTATQARRDQPQDAAAAERRLHDDQASRCSSPSAGIARISVRRTDSTYGPRFATRTGPRTSTCRSSITAGTVRTSRTARIASSLRGGRSRRTRSAPS